MVVIEAVEIELTSYRTRDLEFEQVVINNQNESNLTDTKIQDLPNEAPNDYTRLPEHLQGNLPNEALNGLHQVQCRKYTQASTRKPCKWLTPFVIQSVKSHTLLINSRL